MPSVMNATDDSVEGVTDRDRPKILVVEDEEDIRNMLKISLEAEYGYDVIEADDGQPGLEIAVRENPDLILMDLEMPVMNGIEATYRIKVMPQTQHIPVVIMSANLSAVEWALHARDAGAVAQVRKPINFGALERTIREVLTQSGWAKVPG